jgi:hypothetical protein
MTVWAVRAIGVVPMAERAEVASVVDLEVHDGLLGVEARAVTLPRRSGASGASGGVAVSGWRLAHVVSSLVFDSFLACHVMRIIARRPSTHSSLNQCSKSARFVHILFSGCLATY